MIYCTVLLCIFFGQVATVKFKCFSFIVECCVRHIKVFHALKGIIISCVCSEAVGNQSGCSVISRDDR